MADLFGYADGARNRHGCAFASFCEIPGLPVVQLESARRVVLTHRTCTSGMMELASMVCVLTLVHRRFAGAPSQPAAPLILVVYNDNLPIVDLAVARDPAGCRAPGALHLEPMLQLLADREQELQRVGVATEFRVPDRGRRASAIRRADEAAKEASRRGPDLQDDDALSAALCEASDIFRAGRRDEREVMERF